MRFRNGFRIQCILTGHTSLTFSYGVTFLAFGNGAPDIFSAVAAITNAKNGDAGLAIGALFGKTLQILGAFDYVPRVDPGLPLVSSNSFDVIPGAHPGQPKVPCLWNESRGPINSQLYKCGGPVFFNNNASLHFSFKLRKVVVMVVQ